MISIARTDVPECYQEMLRTESHHTHEIVRDENGTLRWRPDPFVLRLKRDCDLNHIFAGFDARGNDRNCETLRELYRRLGTSLSSYEGVFYDLSNNPECDNYMQPDSEADAK